MRSLSSASDRWARSTTTRCRCAAWSASPATYTRRTRTLSPTNQAATANAIAKLRPPAGRFRTRPAAVPTIKRNAEAASAGSEEPRSRFDATWYIGRAISGNGAAEPLPAALTARAADMSPNDARSFRRRMATATAATSKQMPRRPERGGATISCQRADTATTPATTRSTAKRWLGVTRWSRGGRGTLACSGPSLTLRKVSDGLATKSSAARLMTGDAVVPPRVEICTSRTPQDGDEKPTEGRCARPTRYSSCACLRCLGRGREEGGDDRGEGPHEVLRKEAGGRPAELHRTPRSCDRIPRPQRVREVDDDAHGDGARQSAGWNRHRERPTLPRAQLAVATGRGAPRGQGHPPRPKCPESPSHARCDEPHRRCPGRGDAGSCRAHRCRQPAGGQVLAWHGPAPGYRRRAARRPGGVALRRAGQRPRPRRDPLGAQPAARSRQRRPDRLCLQSSHERDGPHGRRGRRDRPRQTDRADARERAHGFERRRERDSPLTRGGRPPRRTRRCRRLRAGGTRRCSLSPRHACFGHRGPGRSLRFHAARAFSPRRHPRRGVHGADRGQHRLPRYQRICHNEPGRPPVTTATIESQARATAALPAGHYSIPDLLKSEWIKLRSVRSTIWSFVIVVVLGVGIGILATTESRANWPHGGDLGFQPIRTSLVGVDAAQLVIGVLGVLVVTGEYGTGTIRATFSAAPRRPLVLVAKTAVFTVVALIASEVVAFLSFFLGQAMLTAPAPHATLSSPGAVRAVVGSGLYICAIGLLGLGLGVLIRHTAGAIGALVGVLLILPLIIAALPSSIINAVQRYEPLQIGKVMITVPPRIIQGRILGPHGVVKHVVIHAGGTFTFSPWVGFGVLCGYAVGLLLVGTVLLVRRDA